MGTNPNPFTGSVPLGVFGTGTGGAVVLDGVTAFVSQGFGTPAANVYTLTQDVQVSSLVINPGVTITSNSKRIFCTGTVTNNGTIAWNGNNAAGNAAGVALGSTALAGGVAGGAGGTGANGGGANGGAALAGVAGGAGGAGTAGAAGAGGTVTFTGVALSNNYLTQPWAVLSGVFGFQGSSRILGFGAGGGGGGADAAATAGGGGGGGGGIVAIFAAAVVNNGSVTANGGNGAAGTGGNAGGGGGGSGGGILIYTVSAVTGTGTTSVAGGTPGAGSGTGSAGTAGGAGLLVASVI